MNGKIYLGRVLTGLASLAIALDAVAAPAKPASDLVNIADTRGLPPGLSRWIGDVYNTSHWEYGLLVVVVMAAMGLLLGAGFDRALSHLGIDLGRLEHHE
ncbi:MAG: hypothetical protein ACM3JH_09315 [Acidithiobacillales bacterium]